ncbi:MAG: YlbD family protein [Bacillota bacterium]|uniref:YlbD family protein n=1 Tax=Virgibacillus salarius TaxID=447199 RepID=A0A941DXQ3_9BACI|nr:MULTISPECIES: spore coat protein YlbD [Bacillaceae]NAZ08068.1 hypothetical protein [Agaribacter marinus]MBR7795353.1 YlbD family protein [Virgibacillus salarius]MCC2249627.1 YlbD family protein [Virgibacillus sp. AGTR]MDY7044207.1 spore coat protein YlbD [Virgibacillus sp. M23]QRZ16852.1 YlbD family protein [Virgibacillus sp. AGTR]
MSDQKLHPSVLEFKQFINEHPKLIEHIRKSGRPWQETYEKWVLLGEDDPFWEKYKGDKSQTKTQKEKAKKEKNSELFSQLMKMTESMDLEKIQKQIEQFSDSITTIQELIGQFQQNKSTSSQQPNERMGWFRD